MSIVLSNRQLPMLEALADTDFMSIPEAQHFDQRAFRSMLIRKYAVYRPGKGFHLTPEGREARRNFYETDIVRKNPQLPLTSYFDPSAFGLAPRKPKRQAEAKKRIKKPAADNAREFLARGAA